jgi:hypothetical protein
MKELYSICWDSGYEPRSELRTTRESAIKHAEHRMNEYVAPVQIYRMFPSEDGKMRGILVADFDAEITLGFDTSLVYADYVGRGGEHKIGWMSPDEQLSTYCSPEAMEQKSVWDECVAKYGEGF